MTPLHLHFRRILLLVSWLIGSYPGSISAQGGGAPDYTALDAALQDVRIVYLGEQTHLDGATFDAKVALIRHLHEELGFTVLALEGDAFALGHGGAEQLLGNLMPLWSRTEAVHELANYVTTRRGTLRVAGLDSQLGTRYTQDSLVTTLQDLLPAGSRIDYALLQELVDRLTRLDSFTEADARAARGLTKAIDQALAAKAYTAALCAFWTMVTQSILAKIEASVAEEAGRSEPFQNARDRQMAHNLYLLTQQYPGEKIICWVASYHFAKHLRELQFGDSATLAAVSERNARLGHDSLPLAELQELAEAEPMAAVFAWLIPVPTFSLAFTAGEGYINYRFPDEDTLYFTLPAPPPGSWEERLHGGTMGDTLYVFTALDTLPRHLPALGYLPLRANWSRAFDGLYLTPRMYPVTYLPPPPPDTIIADDLATIRGRVVDAVTDQAISYAYVYPAREEVPLLSNMEGYFQGSSGGDSLSVTAIGYATRTVPRTASVVALSPMACRTEEVTVRAGKIDPLQIVQATVNALPFNYPQAPFAARLLWRSVYRDSLLSDTTDAILWVHDRLGYRSDGWERVLASKTARIDSLYRRGNPDTPAGTWDPYAPIDFKGHDPLLANSNALDPARFRYYTYRLRSTQAFGGKKVFVIDFANNKPNAYTAGVTHLATHSGTLYINSDDFAVIRFERLEQRPYTRNVRHEGEKGSTYTSHSFHTRSYQYALRQGAYVLSLASVSVRRELTTSKRQRTIYEDKQLYLLDWQPKVDTPLALSTPQTAPAAAGPPGGRVGQRGSLLAAAIG